MEVRGMRTIQFFDERFEGTFGIFNHRSLYFNESKLQKAPTRSWRETSGLLTSSSFMEKCWIH